MPLQHVVARRVLRAIREGSSWPVVVESARGQFVVKLHGAAQGAIALIAEIIVAELAAGLDLPVPERVLVELPERVPTEDRNDELADLLAASHGLNLGLRHLPGARQLRGDELRRLDDAFKLAVLWLDVWVMNPDRTAQNPNVLLWKGQPWLIDHGAALSFQHAWGDVTEASPLEPMPLSRHLFASERPQLAGASAGFVARFPRERLACATALVPDAFWGAAFPGQDIERLKAQYQAFLWKRLKAPALAGDE